MKIGNVKPVKGFLKQLAVNNDDRCFTDVLNVEWPIEIQKLQAKDGLVEVKHEDLIIGGRMSRHVRQHVDDEGSDLTLLWFPKVNLPLNFCVGADFMRVRSGDVFLFDHTSAHSVSGVGERTGIWYFICQSYNKEVVV
jgi:hypothetical protein